MASVSKASTTKDTKSSRIKPKFQADEKVLCFHGPLLYEAKCLETSIKDEAVTYYIHYSGWNKKWDEWVPEDRVLEHNDVNLKKQTELKTVQNKVQKGKLTQRKSKETGSAVKAKQVNKLVEDSTPTKNLKPAPSTDSGELSRRKKLKPAPKESTEDSSALKKTEQKFNAEDKEAVGIKSEERIKMPEKLKNWLVDDWDLITNHQKLTSLPAKVPIEQLLADFDAHCKKTHEKCYTEIIEGFKMYFNRLLQTSLLYSFEKRQYADVLSKHPDTPLIRVYGPIHLLRMMSKLGEYLALSSFEGELLEEILQVAHELLDYIQSSSSAFDVGDYQKQATSR